HLADGRRLDMAAVAELRRIDVSVDGQPAYELLPAGREAVRAGSQACRSGRGVSLVRHFTGFLWLRRVSLPSGPGWSEGLLSFSRGRGQMKKTPLLVSGSILFGGLLLTTSMSFAKPEYSKNEKAACKTCHVQAVPKKDAAETNDVGKCY